MQENPINYHSKTRTTRAFADMETKNKMEQKKIMQGKQKS